MGWVELSAVGRAGAPLELYHKPANLFVAGFIGSPQMNFIEAGHLSREDAKMIGIRPEHISIVPSGGDISGRVSHVEHLGADTNVYLDCGAAGLVCARLFGEQNFEIDNMVHAKFDETRVFRFDDKGQAIRPTN